ncbi:ABC transporter permease [Paenibacillus rhizoplanae]
MYNLIRAELFKLRKDRSFLVLLLIIALLSLAYPLLYYVDNKTGGKPQFTGAEFLIKFVASNGYVIKFSVAALAGFFIASEYTTGVMKSVASSGNDRGRLYTAKLIGFSAGAMVISLIFPLVSLIEVSMISGFGQLPEGVSALFIPPGPRVHAVVYCCLRSDWGIIHSGVHRERQDNQLPDDLLPGH